MNSDPLPIHQPDGALPAAQLLEAAAALKTSGDNGAKWFYWIAGLSLVNTVISHAGGDFHFILGLASTAIADAIAQMIGKEHPELRIPAIAFAICFSVIVSAVVSLFGWMSCKRWLPMMGLGMGLYLLDGLLYLLFQEWLSAGFHAFALYHLGLGFGAYRQLTQLERTVLESADFKNEQTALETVPPSPPT